MKTTTILRTPLAKLSDVADGLSAIEMQEHVDQLQGIALAAIWRYAYLDQRRGNGCGDQGHKAAVREANRQLVAVRKAMRFSYPAMGTVNV